MNRIDRRALTILLAFCAVTTLGAGVMLAPLLSTQDVLRQIERPASDSAQSAAPASEAAKLLADIKRFRIDSPQMAPAAAAQTWFALFDRAGKIAADAASSDIGAYDVSTSQGVGVESMFAALPPPPTWPLMRKEATQRAARSPDDREALAIRFLAEILSGDRTAAQGTLDTLDGVFSNLSPDERESARTAASTARSQLVRAYGTPDEIANSLELEIRNANANFMPFVEVPDLVGLVGEQQATALLIKALLSSATLHVESGDATRGLARRLALENIDKMRVAQWQLADSIDSTALYEAIEKRFDPVAAKTAADDGEVARRASDYQKHEASAWYFLGAVIAGRQSDAERALVSLAGSSDVYIPRDAVQALRRAGQDDALFKFLTTQLDRRPQLRAWDLYIQEAAFTGHTADAQALIEKILVRKDLPEFLVADLRVRRVSALLAADKLDEAGAGFRMLLAKPAARGEPTLEARFDAAIKAAAVGRLTQRSSLTDLGLKFARATLVVMPEGDHNSRSVEHNRPLWRELRRNDRAGDVQALAVAELTKSGSRSEIQALGGNVLPGELAAMIELTGIASAAGRHSDVLRLLNESTRWGFADAGRMLANTDSLDLPLGVMIARALAANGERDAALRVAHATVSQLPGKDASYELIADLDPAAVESFESMYARDEFEERPLIWKAAVQFKAGAVADAEATIRRAIAIDPSDGEQGPNDRMRAYAVLSEILRRKGDEAGSATYAKAVNAIRLSERADEFHEAGMYERAFKGYRDGLAQFSDAYCIQSRLAVQLFSQGRRTEALEHYRRAYELMPDSFGRVESHCFGCESVFQGADAQTLAERVFTEVIRKTPNKPQAYYLLAYLRQQQERPAEAIQPLRQAVSLDPHYLNAWVHLYEVGEHTYIEPAELDIARLKLLELDPLHRHAQYSVEKVGDLAALWRGAERAGAAVAASKPIRKGVYALEASAAASEKARAALPQTMLEQIKLYEEFSDASGSAGTTVETAAGTLNKHDLIVSAKALMGLETRPHY